MLLICVVGCIFSAVQLSGRHAILVNYMIIDVDDSFINFSM